MSYAVSVKARMPGTEMAVSCPCYLYFIVLLEVLCFFGW